MNTSKIAFFSASWLVVGTIALSVNAFAADSPLKKPAVSQQNVSDMAARGDGPKECMMSNQLGDMKCEHKGGMMGSHMGDMKCDHKGGMMGGHMGDMKCDHKGGMMGGHMGNMMGGHGTGMMESPHIDMIMSLDLNDEQRSKIYKLSDELKHNNWTTKGLIMDESAKLRDLYAADKRDPSAIGNEYQKIFDLQRKMIEATITAQNRIEEILTPEQRAKLKSTRHSGAPMHNHPMH